MQQTIRDNPAHDWQLRQGRGERVTLMLAPRSADAGWMQIVVPNAIPREVDASGFSDAGFAADTRSQRWQIAIEETNGLLLERGDWIQDSGGRWWAVEAVGLEDGAFGQEQRPTAILYRGGDLPWLT